MLYLLNSKGIEGRELIASVFEWDVVNWSQALRLWEPAMREVHSGLHPQAIEIGSRRGGLALFAAVQGFHVLCTDLEDPRESAEPLHEKYQVTDLVDYSALDVTDVKRSSIDQKFDLVLMKSVLGGAGRNGRDDLQMQAVQNMAAMLKPGGAILFAENLAGSAVHRFFRKRFTNWGSYWNYPSIERLSSMFDAAGLILEYRTGGFLGAFGRTEKQRRFLGKIDRALIQRITPRTWHYIYFGVARKPDTVQ
jgi:SAM-dependent methyltransferase